MTDGNYADVSQAQEITNTTGSASDQTWLQNRKPGIDRDIDNTFLKYIDLIPFITGATNDLIMIATWKLASIWFADNKDFVSAKWWSGEADKKTASVQERAKADSDINTRQQTAFFSSDPRNAKIILPTQASIFAFDDFA